MLKIPTPLQALREHPKCQRPVVGSPYSQYVSNQSNIKDHRGSGMALSQSGREKRHKESF